MTTATQIKRQAINEEIAQRVANAGEGCFTAMVHNACRVAKLHHGRNWRSNVRNAWMTGNYEAECLGEFAGILQSLRNDGLGSLRALKFKV